MTLATYFQSFFKLLPLLWRGTRLERLGKGTEHTGPGVCSSFRAYSSGGKTQLREEQAAHVQPQAGGGSSIQFLLRKLTHTSVSADFSQTDLGGRQGTEAFVQHLFQLRTEIRLQRCFRKTSQVEAGKRDLRQERLGALESSVELLR